MDWALGGVFGAVGSDLPADRLATWDGARLEPMRSGAFGMLEVNALASVGQRLYVGGLINAPWDGTGRPLKLVNITEFSNGHWSDLAGGVNRGVAAITGRDAELWVGGGFQRAGDAPSAGVAVWDVGPVRDAPVDLHGRWDCRGIRLQWRLAGNTAATDVLILRSEGAQGPYISIAKVPPRAGITTFDDRWVRANAEYRYQLRLLDVARPAGVSDAIRVSAGRCPVIPLSFVVRLSSHGSASMAYDLDAPGDVTLRVFDVRGRLVRQLIDGWQAAGPYVIPWDGRSGDGGRAVRGVYLAELHTPAGRATQHIPIVRRRSE